MYMYTIHISLFIPIPPPYLSSGRPLFSLPLSSTHAAHGDINSDGVIEHINAVINPGEGEGGGRGKEGGREGGRE